MIGYPTDLSSEAQFRVPGPKSTTDIDMRDRPVLSHLALSLAKAQIGFESQNLLIS